MIRINILVCLTLIVFNKAICQTEQEYLLNGHIKGRDTGSIILLYSDSVHHIFRDTAIVYDGNFQFTGKINQPFFSWLYARGDGNRGSFFLEPAKQDVYLEENNYEAMKVIGSFTQMQDDSLRDQITVIQSQYSGLIKRFDSLRKELDNSPDSLTKMVVQNQVSELSKEIGVMNRKILEKKILFIKAHPNSYTSPTELYGILINRQLPTDSVRMIYYYLAENIKNSIAGLLIQKEFEKRSTNRLIPDFTGLDVNNKTLSFNRFKGKYILVNFWASWCRPCIEEMPELKNLLENYKQKGFDIINISLDKDEQSWKKAINKYELNGFKNIIRNDVIDKIFPNTKEPIPSSILINPTEMVIWNSMMSNSESLSELLKKCFK